MSEPTTPSENNQQETNAGGISGSHTGGAAAAASSHPQPFVRPPPSQTFDPATAFKEAYDCAKMNNNWNKVSSSLMIHPEWLTRIPEGRRWTMLHQIVFSGDVMHLNEVLVLQANNREFRLLCETADHKTVREVASERAHVNPQMMRRIERLVAVDQLLNNAKDRKWGLVKQCITLQPDIVNEKPPYRRFYLGHHLAYVGELDVFRELSTICHFNLDLLAENKTISQVAREHNHVPFAEYVEGLTATSDEAAPTHPHGPPQYSPGFYDDPCISFIPLNVNLDNLFPNSTTSSYHGNHHHHHPTHDEYTANPDVIATHSLLLGPHHSTTGTPLASTHTNNIHEEAYSDHGHKKPVQPKPPTTEITDEEQAAYEKTIKSNVQLMSQQNLLNSITCCITKAILHDPVVAADGFTYEREAIMSWFEQSNRSPMTNQELENLELKPNYAIKSILQLLQDSNAAH